VCPYAPLPALEDDKELICPETEQEKVLAVGGTSESVQGNATLAGGAAMEDAQLPASHMETEGKAPSPALQPSPHQPPELPTLTAVEQNPVNVAPEVVPMV